MLKERYTHSFSRIHSLSRVGSSFTGVILGERTQAKQKKTHLLEEVREEVANSSEDKREVVVEKGSEIFKQKLFDFKLRMIGALSLYSYFGNIPYSELEKGDNMDSFYLFWFLGAAQDDLIDSFSSTDSRGSVGRVGRTKEIMFNSDGGFLQGALNVLRKKIEKSEMGKEEQEYLLDKVESWNEFVSTQEDDVRERDLTDYTFAFSKEYRETQNKHASKTLIALLNWDQCLDPSMQKLESSIPPFSFLTQIIDDIIDVREDLVAKRPSYAVGALVDHSEELRLFQEGLKTYKKDGKMHHFSFKKVAPNAYSQIHDAFMKYKDDLQRENGDKSEGLIFTINSLYRFVPLLEVMLDRAASGTTVY
ncbi:MAG TPA: hypothetical protein VFD45_03220 [Patescibacteria group bacterium]|nr:hypothetical protein [Patescibacteria group bacterium]